MKKCLLFLLSFFVVVTNSCHSGKENVRFPKNIVILIGDGMGSAQIYAAFTVNKGKLNIFRCPYTGFSKTYSASDYITDSAAGGTALSCGQKTKNGCLGVDSLGHPFKSILEYAEENGLSTGLVSTSSVTHATPASFIAHVLSRSMDENIALDFLKTDVDVFIGGGKKFFVNRTDGKNLADSLKKRKYHVLYNMKDIQRVTGGRLACFTADEQNPKYSEGRGNMLPDAASRTLDILNKNPKGFFVMIEGSMIDWGCHANDAKYMIDETLDFDRTVGRVLDFASKDGHTLVIVIADHETGGVTLQGGNIKEGTVNVKFSTEHHTGVMVPVYAFGPGAENFTGVYDNTAVFSKMKALYRFK